MIIEFTVENFRSFRERTTLSFVAEARRSRTGDLIEADQGIQLLPVVGVFGPNGGGKSNLRKALVFFWWAAQNVTHVASGISFPTPAHPGRKPFLLSNATRTEPSVFEVVLFNPTTSTRFRYGFMVSNGAIESEWLEETAVRDVRVSSRYVYQRDGQSFTVPVSQRKALRPLTGYVLPTTLALPIFAQFANPQAVEVAGLLSQDALKILDVSSDMARRATAAVALAQGNPSPETLGRLLAIFDPSIVDVSLEFDATAQVTTFVGGGTSLGPSAPSAVRVMTQHRVDRSDSVRHEFNLLDDESSGIQQIVELAPLLVPALKNGGVVVLDEMGSALHPSVATYLVAQFQSRDTNPHGAQLLFMGHVPYLMSSRSGLAADQIVLCEKDDYEGSRFFRLSSFNVRNDYEIERNYLIGRFGAVPTLTTPLISENDGEGVMSDAL